MTCLAHHFAVILSFATMGLIFVGGLVTTTHSGLSVPDWPLSYGRLMPPMRGGILYEHGHRLAASVVGLLTVFLAALITWKIDRPWLKRTAWAALGLVILQGVLGGLTVIFRLPKPVSIVHACMAQTFFCLAVAMAVWTSPFWQAPPSVNVDSSRLSGIFRLTLLLFGALYLQLFLGAVLRHTGWGISLHMGGAVVASALFLWTAHRLWPLRRDLRILWNWAATGAGGVGVQILLGLTAYFLLAREFASFPPPFAAVALITGHVTLGAFLLGLSVVLVLSTYRLQSSVGDLGNFWPRAVRPPARVADYFSLTKPGISFMAGVATLAGFVLGSRGNVDQDRLIHAVVGTCLVSAGACALNMLMEIEVDARMRRTANRPLPAKRLQPGEALLFGTLLSVAGILYLSWSVNFLTAFLAGLTLGVYLYLYTPLKKITALCVAVGAVAGALPPVIGWTAATGSLGLEAAGLFAILFFWQYPHFLALAWMYREDYARAGLSVLPSWESDGENTARTIVLHSVALLGVSLLPTFLGLTGRLYLLMAVFLGGGFTVTGLLFFRDRSRPRARDLFLASVLYLPLLLVAMILNRLPFLS